MTLVAEKCKRVQALTCCRICFSTHDIGVLRRNISTGTAFRSEYGSLDSHSEGAGGSGEEKDQ